MTTKGDLRLVAAACRRAMSAGVTQGMTLAQARALCGAETIEVPSQPERDAKSLRRLAQWCTRYAPSAAVAAGEGPAAIVVDITGSAHLHGGEARLCAKVLRDLHLRGIHAQIAAAATQTAALAASIAWPCRVLAGAERNADADTEISPLLELPLRTLRLSAELLECLREVNVTRIGEALKLPRDGLADRYGPELLASLDALRGIAPEPFDPLPHPAPLVIERLFDGATTRSETLTLAVHQGLERFCELLARRHRGVRLIELEVMRIDALPVIERLHLGQATRRLRHLWSLLRPRVESIHMGYGVEGIRIRSLADSRLRHGQLRWSESGPFVEEQQGESESARQLGELLDHVSARLGPASIAEAAIDAAPSMRPTLSLCRLAAGVEVTPANGAEKSQRPLAIRWIGGRKPITQSVGPERIAPEWWNGRTAEACDFWRAQTSDGRWLWLCHDRAEDRWWVTGVWA